MHATNFYSLRDPLHPHQTDRVLDNEAKSPPHLPQPFSTLKLGTLNVRGLRSKFEDVLYTLVAEQMDILCLTETLLSSDIVDEEVQVDGYCLVRQDRTALAVVAGSRCIFTSPYPYVVFNFLLTHRTASKDQKLKLCLSNFKDNGEIFFSPEKIFRSKSTNQEGVHSAHQTGLCFAISRFSQVVFIPRAQPSAQSFFFFFSISNSFWY